MHPSAKLVPIKKFVTLHSNSQKYSHPPMIPPIPTAQFVTVFTFHLINNDKALRHYHRSPSDWFQIKWGVSETHILIIIIFIKNDGRSLKLWCFFISKLIHFILFSRNLLCFSRFPLINQFCQSIYIYFPLIYWTETFLNWSEVALSELCIVSCSSFTK